MPLSPNPYAALKEASQYVRLFRGKTFVVKVGGDVLVDPKIRKALCEQIALLWSFSIKVVVVHGGGAELDAVCASMNIPVQKVAGRRITTPEVLDAAKMVFAGQVHMDLLAELQAAGVPAVGLTHLLEGGYLPEVAPLSGGEDGTIYNTNADTIAASLASALCAEKLFFLLSVPGLLKDVKKSSSLVPHATLDELAALEAKGVISGGMRPKVAAVKAALLGGAQSVHLVSGIVADALLAEVFTNEGSGTMIVANAPVA